jgi:CRP-like cAMP-binding protein
MVHQPDDRTIANRLLRALPPAVLRRVQAHLEPVDLARGHVIARSDKPAGDVYFINRGMVSLIKTMADGRTAEISVIGIEGMADFSALFGFDTAILDTVVQIPGAGLRISRRALHAEMSHSPALREVLLRYLQWSIGQLAQTAACNRLHGLEERCCRWLLAAHDSARADDFVLTHEFLALILGVQRAGVTLTAGMLRKAGFIEYTRGRITIHDRPGLEATACECYALLARRFGELFGSVAR